jgi:hypothetical protein
MRIEKRGAPEESATFNMPATSKKQAALFGAAIAAKRGKKTFPAAEKLAAQMPESKLKDFTKLKKKK